MNKYLILLFCMLIIMSSTVPSNPTSLQNLPSNIPSSNTTQVPKTNKNINEVIQKSDISENSPGYVMIPADNGDILYIEKNGIFPQGTGGWYFLEKAGTFAKRDKNTPLNLPNQQPNNSSQLPNQQPNNSSQLPNQQPNNSSQLPNQQPNNSAQQMLESSIVPPLQQGQNVNTNQVLNSPQENFSQENFSQLSQNKQQNDLQHNMSTNQFLKPMVIDGITYYPMSNKAENNQNNNSSSIPLQNNVPNSLNNVGIRQ